MALRTGEAMEVNIYIDKSNDSPLLTILGFLYQQCGDLFSMQKILYGMTCSLNSILTSSADAAFSQT